MKKQCNPIKIIWWVYIILLFFLVVVKFRGSLMELIDRIESYSRDGSINYNLIPFNTIGYQIEFITERWAIMNLLGNIVPFIPFGFLLPITYRKINNGYKVALVGVFAIIGIELFQLITKLGNFDIDDVMLNMMGIVCGYWLILLVNHMFFRKRKSF